MNKLGQKITRLDENSIYKYLTDLFLNITFSQKKVTD